MKKDTMQFAIEKDRNKAVKRIGKSVILQPKPHFSGERTKWFDDSKLLKKKKQKTGCDGIAVGDSVLRIPFSNIARKI